MHILTILMDYMGLTQVELAKKADISPADLNEMINKAPYGMITKYHRLAQYLCVSVDSIVNNDILSISETFFAKHRHGPYLKTPSNKQAALGREAEEEVFQMEKERVMTFSPTLSKLVLPYYKMRASSPGYDILSYSLDGSPIFIEVKNSVKNNIANFHLTSHEFDVANKATDVGYLILSMFSLVGIPRISSSILDPLKSCKMKRGFQWAVISAILGNSAPKLTGSHTIA